MGIKSSLTPPRSFNAIRRRVAIVLAILLVAVAAVGIGLRSWDVSSAASLVRGDINQASSGGIVLDNNIHTRSPTWNVSTSVDNHFDDGTVYDDNYRTFWYALDCKPGQYTYLGRDITAKWTNCGFDNANNRIDLVMTFKSDSRFWTTNRGSWIALLDQYPTNIYGSAGWCLNPDVWNGGRSSCDMHIQLNFYKTGTTTPAVGSFFSKFQDLDQPGWKWAYGNDWDESIEFISGHGTMYIPSNSVLRIKSNRNGEANTYFLGTQTTYGTMISGVATNLNNGANFWFHGAKERYPNGTTDVLDGFEPKIITISAGAGGSVKCGGISGSIPVGWRCNRTINITPNAGYHIVDVKVDGVSQGAKTSYTFSNVTANHTISATFAINTYTVRFLDSLNNNSVIKTQRVNHGAAATAPTPPSHPGYTFKGWNKTFASITANTDVVAQYTPNKYTIRYNANGGANTMPDQAMTYNTAANLTANAFSRLDYDWVGWNTAANGSGTSYAQKQSVKNLTTTPQGVVTMYAQWRPHTNARLSVEKTVDKEKATVGDKLTYHITVTNTGDITLKNVLLDDELLGIRGEKISDRLNPGQSIAVSYEYPAVTEDDAIAGVVSNTASASAVSFLDELNNPAPQSSTASTVIESNPLLVVEKTASSEALENPSAGDNLEYEVKVSNEGNITLRDIAVSDVLSNGKALELSFPKDVLAPGESMTAHAAYMLTQADIDAGELTNNASATCKDPSRPDEEIEGVPDSATTVLARRSALSFEKVADKEHASIGDSITYTFIATNTGNTTLDNITLADPLLSIDGAIIAEKLLPGEQATFEATYAEVMQADAIAGAVVNEAFASSNTPEGCPSIEDIPSSVSTSVSARPSMRVEKSSDAEKLDNPMMGDEITYSIMVENTGDIDLNDVDIVDVLSNGKTLELGEYDRTLPVGEKIELSVVYALTQDDIDAGVISNTVHATSTSPAGNVPIDEGDDTSTELVRNPDYVVEKKAKSDSVEIGEGIEYDIVVTNTGNTTLHDLVLDDELTGDIGKLVKETLLPGDAVTTTVVYPVVTEADAIAGAVRNIVSVRASSPGADDELGRSDKVETTVTSSPELSFSKTVDIAELDSVHAGTQIVWHFEVRNTGNITIKDVGISDDMLTSNGYVIALDKKTLSPGEHASADVRYAVTQADIDSGKVVNIATAGGTSVGAGEPSVESPSSECSASIAQDAKLAISKEVSQDVAEIGDELHYKIILRNAGNTSLHSVQMSDALLGDIDVAELMLPRETTAIEADLTVSEDDAIAKLIESPVSATAKTPDDSQTQPVQDYVETQVVSHPSMAFEKTLDMGDKEAFYAGDEVTWRVVIENTGDITLRDIAVHDKFLESKGTPFTVEDGAILAPGEKMELEVSYVLTQDDIDAGFISNTAHATASSTDGADIEAEESTASSDIERTASSKVTKIADRNYIANAEAGEEILYTVVVENTGNTTLSNVEVIDELDGAKRDEIKWDGQEAILLPGEKVEAIFSYKVSESDIAAGKIVNSAYAKYDIPSDEQDFEKDGIELESSQSEKASVETGLVPPDETDVLDELVEFVIDNDAVPLGQMLLQTGDAKHALIAVLGALGIAIAGAVFTFFIRRRAK